ncbi:hypothetical protein OHD62_33290 [Mesorhizobium sp. YC-39]|uniref:hypothetical protein n=1 Tax=unclassified Mesorhizobium TaxID=325217 RepID=UPI0021E7E974|nr:MULTISPECIES: hypothetical protein [unclassified Mesorhizobium]MCV3211558.1 hypothetical protein [Mesorhizobium sp. YC-2]MCV3233244.1 hypothetical protein [Mesorhizobium sp. YC-39]
MPGFYETAVALVLAYQKAAAPVAMPDVAEAEAAAQLLLRACVNPYASTPGAVDADQDIQCLETQKPPRLDRDGY